MHAQMHAAATRETPLKLQLCDRSLAYLGSGLTANEAVAALLKHVEGFPLHASDGSLLSPAKRRRVVQELVCRRVLEATREESAVEVAAETKAYAEMVEAMEA